MDAVVKIGATRRAKLQLNKNQNSVTFLQHFDTIGSMTERASGL